MLKQAINKAQQGTTDLLQNKNNIKLQNNEKKITSFPICSMCQWIYSPLDSNSTNKSQLGQMARFYLLLALFN